MITPKSFTWDLTGILYKNGAEQDLIGRSSHLSKFRDRPEVQTVTHNIDYLDLFSFLSAVKSGLLKPSSG